MSPEIEEVKELVNLCIDFGWRFINWNLERHKWSQATFGTSAERGPVGPLKHLAKEVQEMLAETDRNKRLEEYADGIFLIFDAADRDGYRLENIMAALEQKLEKNRSRQWQKPTSDEPVEHVRKH